MWNITNYQLLQIGDWYILKGHKSREHPAKSAQKTSHILIFWIHDIATSSYVTTAKNIPCNLMGEIRENGASGLQHRSGLHHGLSHGYPWSFSVHSGHGDLLAKAWTASVWLYSLHPAAQDGPCAVDDTTWCRIFFKSSSLYWLNNLDFKSGCDTSMALWEPAWYIGQNFLELHEPWSVSAESTNFSSLWSAGWCCPQLL